MVETQDGDKVVTNPKPDVRAITSGATNSLHFDSKVGPVPAANVAGMIVPTMTTPDLETGDDVGSKPSGFTQAENTFPAIAKPNEGKNPVSPP